MKGIKHGYSDGNGIIDRDQFQAFMMKMNECAIARGPKGRAYTEEEWNMLWAAFNGYNGGNPEPFYEGEWQNESNRGAPHGTELFLFLSFCLSETTFSIFPLSILKN